MRPSKLHPFGQQIQESLYVSISKALSLTSNIKQLHKIHSLLITSGLDRTVFFSGKLISKYAQLKDPNSCSSVFITVSPTNNVYQWNTIIRAMTHNGLFIQALNHYTKMRVLNIKPDTFTFPSVINSCAGSGQFETAKLVHEHVLELGFQSDIYIGNALIDMYARFSALDKARQVFEEMPKRDVVSWNSLVSGYSAHEEWEQAFETFYQSRTAGLTPDSFMISSVLPACSGLNAIMEGQIVHGLTVKLGIHINTRVCNSLLSMYLKSNKLEECHKVFNEIAIKDTITWNTIISGHIQDLKSGKFVHNYMVVNGYECDITASNILINMYAKCGNMTAAREVFNKMETKDLTSWNSLINGFIKASQYEKTMETFTSMKMDIKPDFVTYVTVLPMCTLLMNLNLSKELHCETIKMGFDSTIIVRNALIDVYAKCDKMDDALNEFENIKDRDIVTWNTIISACCHLEEYKLGFKMIGRMRNEGILPNMATILSIFPLCSNYGAKRQVIRAW
ncbi:hypothetical protein L1887_18346 [Cichorium endivia]|nr:hypothetical protein L1887_18346 [Cichorium endivia]